MTIEQAEQASRKDPHNTFLRYKAAQLRKYLDPPKCNLSCCNLEPKHKRQLKKNLK